MSTSDAATIQALSALAVAVLTLVLVVVAAKALGASNRQAAESAKQAEASAKQADASKAQAEASATVIAEMRRDRHLAALPMLALTLNPLDTSQVNRVLSVVYFTNTSNSPALNVRVQFREAWDKGKPQEINIATPPPIPVIGPGEKQNLPVDLSRFPRAEPPRTIHTDWVAILVEFEGLLGANLTEEWYWEPYEWEGMNEPVAGHGEKLVLYRVSGTSGADGQRADVQWPRPNASV